MANDKVVFCTEWTTAKVRNIRRDPRVVLSVEDEARNPSGAQQHLVIHGTARVVGPADRVLCDTLCRVYLGQANHPLNLSRSATAVTVAVTVERSEATAPGSLDDGQRP